MGIKVSQMPSTNTLTDNDLVMVVQDNENKKINKKDLQNNLTDPSLTKRVEELEKENAYLNNLVEQAFDKKEVEGEELSINDTIEAKMNVSLYGNTKQETTKGKNLLPNNATTQTINGVKFTVNEDGTVKANGTATAESTLVLNSGRTWFTKTGTFMLSGCPKGEQNNYIIRYGGTNTYTDNGNGIEIKENDENVYKYCQITIKSGISVNNLVFKPMIRLASITDDTYEKYTGGIASPNPDYPQEIQSVTGNNSVSITGKNLFDDSIVTNLWSNYSTQEIINVNRSNLHKYECKQGDTYTLSATFDSASGNGAILIQFFDKEGNSLGRHAVSNSTTLTQTRTAPADTSYAYIGRYLTTPTTIQLEKNTQATTYEAYTGASYPVNLGSIELCKIGNYQDYFYKNNNKWYKREVIGSLTLDGLNWTAEKISNDIYRMTSTNSIFKGETEVSKISELFCNIYKKGSANTTYIKQTGINLYKNLIYVYDSNYNTSTSVDSFKTMLKEKNAILYGILPEPRDIEITDTTLIFQLEALKTAMSYTEQTNISQINDDIPFILKVTALASYNSRIVALENAILNANRSTQTKNARKSNEIIEEPKKEVVDE